MTYLEKTHTDIDCIIKSIEKSDEGELNFSAYAAITEVEDSDNDVIKRGAFSECIKYAESTGRYPKLLYQHRDEQVIGVLNFMEEDNIGLLVKGTIVATELGKDVQKLVKAKAIDSMSIRGHIKEAFKDPSNGGRVISMMKDLMETSFVTFPANKGANVLTIKNEDGTLNVRVIEKSLRDVGLSRNEAKKLINGGINQLKQRDAELIHEDILKQLKELNDLVKL